MSEQGSTKEPFDREKAIDALAKSISKLCHTVIRRRLGQFFEVIEEEVARNDSGVHVARLLDALNREPGESLVDWEKRAVAARSEFRSRQ